MQADVDMMQSFASKYGKVGMTSVLHLKEALVFLTEKPEILQQAVFVDILKRHAGKVRVAVRLKVILRRTFTCWSEQCKIATKNEVTTLVCGCSER